MNSHRSEGATPGVRGWWIPLGLGVSAVSAAASSFDGLRLLARLAGWSVWMSPALPATIDALSITATGIWIMDTASSPRVRRFARTCALAAILMSVGGNAAYHLLAAGLLELNWTVVLGVGMVPPIVLGLCSHLAALRRLAVTGSVFQAHAGTAGVDPGTAPPAPGTKAAPMVETTAESLGLPLLPEKPVMKQPKPRPGKVSRVPLPDDDLLVAARAADEEYRRRYGRGVTRDVLRTTLHIGGTRATDLLRRLRAEDATPGAPTIGANGEAVHMRPEASPDLSLDDRSVL